MGGGAVGSGCSSGSWTRTLLGTMRKFLGKH